MPKTKALGLYGEKDINLSRAIEACMKRSGKTANELVEKGYFSRSTHHNHLNHPEKMPLKDLRVYIREAHIPPEDIIEALYLNGK